MSSTERKPGQASPDINKEDLKVERLRVLMSYDKKTDIKTKELAEAWGVPPTTVGAIISAAITGKKLRAELLEHYDLHPSRYTGVVLYS